MYKINFPNNKQFEKMNAIAIELFETESDDTQASPTLENCLRVVKKEKYNFILVKDTNDELMGWSVVMPTSLEVMDNFLSEEITERELLEISRIDSKFEALYLFAVIVLPEYRKKGLAKFLFKTQIEYFKEKYNINNIYSWWFSEEGKKLGDSLEKELDVEIKAIVKFN